MRKDNIFFGLSQSTWCFDGIDCKIMSWQPCQSWRRKNRNPFIPGHLTNQRKRPKKMAFGVQDDQLSVYPAMFWIPIPSIYPIILINTIFCILVYSVAMMFDLELFVILYDFCKRHIIVPFWASLSPFVSSFWFLLLSHQSIYRTVVFR